MATYTRSYSFYKEVFYVWVFVRNYKCDADERAKLTVFKYDTVWYGIRSISHIDFLCVWE